MDANKSVVSVPIPTCQFLELTDFLRNKKDQRDPVLVISDAIDYWLLNADFKPELLVEEKSGNGYQWKKLFLPHGTKLRMQYKEVYFYAKIEGDEVIYEGKPVSPATMVNAISGTSRSAWRDLWFKRPEDKEWLPAKDWSKQRERSIELGEKLFKELSELP